MNNNIYDSSEFGSSKKKYINYINKNKSSKSSMKNIKKGNSNYSSSKSISSKDQIKDFIQNTIKKEIIGRLNKKDKKLETIINNNIHNNYKRNINNRYKTNNTSTNFNINININSNIFYNNNTSKKKRIFSPEIYSIDKVKIMEDKIRKIKSKEKFKHYYHSREKLINLKKQKTTFEERINTLEKYIKKNKKQNNINNLKISTLEEELSNKPKLPKNNFKKLIKETIKQKEELELYIKNTYEETQKIVDEIFYTKNVISEIQQEIQEIKNTNSLLIKDKNDIINQINSFKKKSEALKGRINKYNYLSNDLLYDVDLFMNSLK